MSFPCIHRISVGGFVNIFTGAKYLLVNAHAHRGDIIIMQRGQIEICRGEVSALASLVTDPADKGTAPDWMTCYNREKVA